jgi:hypothetical protein
MEGVRMHAAFAEAVVVVVDPFDPVGVVAVPSLHREPARSATPAQPILPIAWRRPISVVLMR